MTADEPPRRYPNSLILLTMVLVIAGAGLVYELVIAAVASYLLGDSVTQFSTVIGVYLSALGLGAYASRLVRTHVNVAFVDVELSTALVGGLSAPALFLAFSFTGAFQLILYTTVVLVGTLVGLELPLLIRILKSQYAFDELIARALSFDYAGALVGSLAFSLLLVPRLGLVHTSVVCGLINAVVGLASTWVLVAVDGPERRALLRARYRAALVTTLLMVTLGFASRILALAESALYRPARVQLAVQSPYQRIVFARSPGGFRLYLNGHLQFDSADEYRYHEALVHPAMSAAAHPQRVLIGGGGDGLALREVLRWPGVESVVLVDLDAKMTDLARDHRPLADLNERALFDDRVRVVNADAMVWFSQAKEAFDVVILDFPDPSNYSIGKLYSQSFYALAWKRLAPAGALVVQSTSPLFARRAFWCVASTLESVGFHTRPYRTFIPSFGEWGFVLARREPFVWPEKLPERLRFLDPGILATLVHFPRDMQRVETEESSLNNQAIVAYYTDAWSRF